MLIAGLHMVRKFCNEKLVKAESAVSYAAGLGNTDQNIVHPALHAYTTQQRCSISHIYIPINVRLGGEERLKLRERVGVGKIGQRHVV